MYKRQHVIISKLKRKGEKTVFKCDYGDCKYSTPRPSYLRQHKQTHAKKNQKYKCKYVSCESKFSLSCELEAHTRKHKKTHISAKTYKCKYKDCGINLSTSSELEAHKIVVHNFKNHKKTMTKKEIECELCGLIFSQYGKYFRHKCKHFKCDYKKCKYKTSQPEKLVIHKKKHTEKNYECEYANCGLKFSQSSSLVSHVRRYHTFEKPFLCNYKNCESKFVTSSELISHKLIHTGKKRYTEKKYKCDYENCKSKFSTSSLLTNHKRTHTGERPYKCDYEGCESKFSQSGNLAKHKETHTIEGQIHRKTQENNLKKKIEKWGFTVDAETVINSQRGDCLTDTNRYYSRIDYHVINCTNAILLVECDEDQHNWYELSCEFSRMSDVRASLLTAGYELPIYWIRYNPNGKYHIGGEQVKLNRLKREVSLKEKIEELCSPEFVPDNQVNIHYMFYDLMSEELGPEIMIESDFPEHLQECVSWH